VSVFISLSLSLRLGYCTKVVVWRAVVSFTQTVGTIGVFLGCYWCATMWYSSIHSFLISGVVRQRRLGLPCAVSCLCCVLSGYELTV